LQGLALFFILGDMLRKSPRVGGRRQFGRRSVAAWLREHPELGRRTLGALVLIAGVSVLFQLAYPAGRTLPFVRAQGLAVGGITRSEVTQRLEASFAKATVHLKTDAKTIRTTMAETGADVDTAATARAAADYPFGLRFIPFSSVVLMATRDTPTIMQYDDERVDAYATRIEKEAFAPAVNATVQVKQGEATVAPATPQKSYPARMIRTLVRATHFAPQTTLTPQPETKAPTRANRDVADVLQMAQKAVATPLTLDVAGVKTVVDRPTIGSWLHFPEDATTKELTMAVQPAALRAYFEKHQPAAYAPAGTTKVQVIDGREVGRTVGATGKGIDADKAAGVLEAALKKGSKVTVSLPIATIAPQVVYERSYSNSDAGLKAVVDAAAGSYGVAVMEMGGRSANTNGSKQFVSASTYKLYIAYAVAKEVEAGRMRWDDPFNGQTVASCFDKMIVVSDNACPKAFGARFGWQAVEDMMHGLGLSSATQLSPANYTTANDLALFLYKLQNGSLLSADSTNRLTDAMKRQSYTRAGIPAGAKGSAVADKVGDVDGYKHDAAIVYGPKGPYVLIVMTSGGSWAGIAAVTSQIHAYLSK
jgi:beta-lactamase class A